MWLAVRCLGLVNLSMLLVMAHTSGADAGARHKKSVTRHFKRSPVPNGWTIPGLNAGSDEEKVAEIQRLEKERVAREWEEGMFSPYKERLLKLEFDRLAREGTPNLSQRDIEKLMQMNPGAVEQCATGNVKMCALLTAAKDQIRQPSARKEGESVNAYIGLERDTNTELVSEAVNPADDPKDKRAAAWGETMDSDMARFEHAVSPDLQWLAKQTKHWKDGVPVLGHPVTTMSALKHRLTLYAKLSADAVAEEKAEIGASKQSKRSKGGKNTPAHDGGQNGQAAVDDRSHPHMDELLAPPAASEPGHAVPASMETRSEVSTEQVTTAPTQRVEDVVELMTRSAQSVAAAAQAENGRQYRLQLPEDQVDAKVQLDGCRVLDELASHQRAASFSSITADNKGDVLFERGIEAVLTALRFYDRACGGSADYNSGLDSPSTKVEKEANLAAAEGSSSDIDEAGDAGSGSAGKLSSSTIRKGGGAWLPSSEVGLCVSADIQAACLDAVGTLATRDNSHAHKIAQLDGYEIVMHGLSAYQASAAVQAAGLRALSQLVVGQSVDPKVAEVAEVGSQVNPHTEQPQLPTGGGGEIELLAEVPEDDEDEDEVKDEDENERTEVAEAEDSNYAVDGSSGLSRSEGVGGSSEEQRRAAGASAAARGALKYAMLAMLRHESSADVAESTCQMLGVLASKDPTVARAIYQGGVLESISKSLRTHVSLASVQEQCVNALAHVAENGVAFAREVASSEVHGIEAAVTAMHTHQHSASIQEVGCRLLANLGSHEVWRGWGAGYDPSTDDPRAMDASAWSAAFDGGVLEWLGGFFSMSGSSKRKRDLPMVTYWMTRAGGFAALAQAMELHPGEETVQAQSAAVIRSLATHSPHNKLAVLEAGATGLILVALEMHPGSAELQEHGLWALVALLTEMPITPGYDAAALHMMPVTSWISSLGVPSAGFNADPAIRRQVLEAGGVNMVLAALRAHRNNEAVLISGVALLACLAHGDDSTKEVIVAHDGIKAIVTAMKENAGAFRVTVGACAAISTIAAATDGGSSQAKRAVFESGAMTQVLHALQVFSQPKVHAECAGAVANVVAGETEHASAMLQLGAERVILNSLMKHPGWGQVQANGCIALRNLGRDEAYPGQLLHDGRVVPSCMADFWGTLRHSFSWYGWCLRFGTTAVALWLSYEFVALLEALFAGYLFAYFGWGYDSQGNLVNLNQLYAAEGGEQELQRRAKEASRNSKKRR